MALCKVKVVKNGKTETPQEFVCNGVSFDNVFARKNSNDAYVLVFSKKGGIYMVRSKIAAGNWKMNPATLGEAVELAKQIKDMCDSIIDDGEKCILFVPSCFISAVAEELRGTNIKVGVQLISASERGAYTGQVSASQVASCGATWVIVGHSEVRDYLYDDANTFRNQIYLALQNGMKVLYCVGENLQEYESGLREEVVISQLTDTLFNFSAEDVSKIVIVYEPIWAIGTGKMCTPTNAQEIMSVIRQQIAEKYGPEVAANISICFGGSVKPSNAAEIVAQSDIDGALMGGVSLKPEDFVATADIIF